MSILRSRKELLEAQDRMHVLGLCPMPDERKVWDNLLALEDIRDLGLGQDEPIADLGCRSGILLTWLDQLGYRRLYGCDLQRPYPPIRSALAQGKFRTAACGARMYFRNRRRFAIAAVEQTPFPSGIFGAVTSMSVIEHGVDTDRFFAEAARLLRHGGLLLVSADYWPNGVETAGLRRFKGTPRDDRVFSADDVRALMDEAAAHGLFVLREPDLEAGEPLIDSNGFHYTFIALRFERSASL